MIAFSAIVIIDASIMSRSTSILSSAAKAFHPGVAALLLSLSPAVAQAPAARFREETAAALPADEPALEAVAGGEAQTGGAVSGAESASSNAAAPKVEDYTAKIGLGMKERERRLNLLNEAMIKLREAGEMEDAGRVEERICALLEMPEPSQAGARLRAEIEQMRAKNDDLIVQMVAMEEELKRYRGPSSGMASSRKR